MVKTPMEAFNVLFASEEDCQQYLTKTRWGESPECPFCRNKKIYQFRNGRQYKCAKCRKQFTVKVGTIFESSKIPLKNWFYAIWLLSSETDGLSSTSLSRQLGVTQKTAWFMLRGIKTKINAGKVETGKEEGSGLLKRDKPMMRGIDESFEDILPLLVQSKPHKSRKTAALKKQPVMQSRPISHFDPETD